MSDRSNGGIHISNARIVLPDTILPQAKLWILGESIIGVYSHEASSFEQIDRSSKPAVSIDFAGDFLIPGLIDLHVHGCGGADTMDAEPTALQTMATELLRHGTTGFLATTMTAAASRSAEVMAAGTKVEQGYGQAEFLGFHLEGPCISAAYRGAQNITELPPADFPINSLVKIITLAPELSEAAGIIEKAAAAGVLLSAGHSGASYEQMEVAINRGVLQVTHAFNAMPGIHHRKPGLLTAALLDHRVTLELIADGVHIHPAVLELALRLKTPEKVVLVSDGTRAVGLTDGEYELGGQTVRLEDGRMTLADGTIAGSALPLLAGVRLVTAVVGRPLFEAVRMATLNPARLLQVEDRLGSIEKGKEANFLRLSPTLELKEVWYRGRLIHY